MRQATSYRKTGLRSSPRSRPWPAPARRGSPLHRSWRPRWAARAAMRRIEQAAGHAALHRVRDRAGHAARMAAHRRSSRPSPICCRRMNPVWPAHQAPRSPARGWPGDRPSASDPLSVNRQLHSGGGGCASGLRVSAPVMSVSAPLAAMPELSRLASCKVGLREAVPIGRPNENVATWMEETARREHALLPAFGHARLASQQRGDVLIARFCRGQCENARDRSRRTRHARPSAGYAVLTSIRSRNAYTSIALHGTNLHIRTFRSISLVRNQSCRGVNRRCNDATRKLYERSAKSFESLGKPRLHKSSKHRVDKDDEEKFARA